MKAGAQIGERQLELQLKLMVQVLRAVQLGLEPAKSCDVLSPWFVESKISQSRSACLHFSQWCTRLDSCKQGSDAQTALQGFL